MRILFLESHPMWIHGLPNGFRDLGHYVETMGPVNEKTDLILKVRQFSPALIFTIGWTPDNDTPEKQLLINQCAQKSHTPLIYWATEDPGYTESFTLPLIRRVKPDFIFTICQAKVEYYVSLGIPAAHLDFGYHSTAHFSTFIHERYRGDFALVANGYEQLYQKNPGLYRFQSLHTLIDPLLKNNFRVDFYGRYWDRMRSIFTPAIPRDWIHGYIPYPETSKIYNSVAITIGLQNTTYQLTQRTYEILGSGGLLLTSDTPAVREWFTPGKDLLVSASEKETIELARYYLANPWKRQKISTQGQKSVLKFSYQHRAEYILTILQKHHIL